MPPFPHLSDDEKEAIAAYLLNVDADGNLNVPEAQPETGQLYTWRHEVATAYQRFVDEDGYFATAPP